MCGNWVSMAYAKHIHVAQEATSLSEMISARAAGLDGINVNYQITPWTPECETRKVPDDGQPS